MKPGANGELIFDSTAEARIASELLIKLFKQNLLADVGLEPPLQQPRIGVIDAINRRIEDRLGTSHPQQHVVADPEKAKLTAQAVSVASMPNNIIFPPRYTRPFRRKSYMATRVRHYYQEVRATRPQDID